MTTFYTIAVPEHHVAGHGDNYTGLSIKRGGSYESGEFPPLFVTEEEASAFIANSEEWKWNGRVVELVVYGTDQETS